MIGDVGYFSQSFILPWFEVIGYYFPVLVHVVYASQEVSRIRPVS